MAHVVEQGRGARGGAILIADVVSFAEPIQHPAHQVEGAERVCKARVFRALISVESEAELFDASQSLKFRRVDQTHHQLAFDRVGAKTNDVVNRIAIDSFRQNLFSERESADSLAQHKQPAAAP